MKLLLLTDGIPPFVMGGMQKHSYLLAKYLAKEGVDIELHHCMLNQSFDQKLLPFSEDELSNIQIVTHDFPESVKFPGHYLYNSFRYSSMVFESIKNRLDEFDFVYAKGFAAWKLIIEKRKGLQCPPIGVKFHGMNMFLPTTGLKPNLEQVMLKPPVLYNLDKADWVFSYGGKVTQTLLDIDIPKRKIIEIPTGIEKHWLKTDFNKKSGNVKFVFVGRYDIVKGIRELHKAILNLSGDFEFHFIGPFDNKHQIKSTHCTYHGTIKDAEQMKNLMDSMDVLVLPSYSEGMPNVILEAMARGLAIIATDVGAVNALVNNKNGHLIPKSNEKLIQKVLQKMIVATDLEINEMKKASIQSVQHFTWEYLTKLTLNEIKNLIPSN